MQSKGPCRRFPAARNQSAVQARGEGPVLLEAFVAKKLREHQKEGVRFMYDAIAKNRGCILADTMGLGKSLQALALLWAVLSNNLLRKAIIVCPSSLCGNWRAEVKKWLGDKRLKPTVIESGKEKILSQIREFRDFASRRLLVISYDQLRRHVQLVDDVCDLLICDEGHRLRSQGTATSKTLGQMRCRRRILLSGTPLQNDLEELFHCGRFVRPDLFAPQSPGYMAPKAAAWAVQCAREPLATPEEKALGQQVTRELEQKTLQFLLRRTMEMVNFNLPPRVEIVLRLRLAPVQVAAYQALLNDLHCGPHSMAKALKCGCQGW
ncbi:Protein CHROMATIN REMODELING 25 (AtCHR25) (DNA repair and recombination protein RAD54) (AtRAD54) [Durusdinium trenchii]|uniref:Protein CHROMATIN REMODELING 25 (AtCHR25) (DNA repair and recombination protein RAD54) (AtRAD54) n=1 Tax=Durusdinium trenchii TaxID=1381693 RepID=A0ABP0RQ06_9DINO